MRHSPPEVSTFRARLRKGDTLQITFPGEGEPGELQIEGFGDVQLSIRVPKPITAELVHTAAPPADRRERS